jgi:hypothetical protein
MSKGEQRREGRAEASQEGQRQAEEVKAEQRRTKSSKEG